MKKIKTVVIAASIIVVAGCCAKANADELSDYKLAVQEVRILEQKVKDYSVEIGLKEARKKRNKAKKAFEETIN